MPLFPTLNTVRLTFANVGAPTIQASTNSPSYVPMQVSTKSTGINVLGTPSASESAIKNLVGLTISEGQLSKLANPSLSTLMKEFTTNPKTVIPAFSSAINKISPTYIAHLQPRIMHRPESSDELAVSTREFEPYELLTGISHERPEIVMMLPFVPLYKQESGNTKPAVLDIVESSGIDPHMTDAGWYADTQMHARNLRVINVIKDLRSFSKVNHHIQNTYAQRKRDMEKTIDQLKDVTQFLLDVVKKSDIVKNQLDLRDDIHKVVVSTTIDKFVQTTQTSTSVRNSVLHQISKKYLLPTYNVSDVLVRLGYPSEESKTLYSSTKMWLQVLLEYKHILKDHSLEFLDIEPSAQRRDKNASTLTKVDAPAFGLSVDDAFGLESISAIASSRPSDIKELQKTISKAFIKIYDKGAHFKSQEAKIAALANLLSKEHKYSAGLGDQAVQRSLSEYYGHVVNSTGQGNMTLWDRVIGQFGQNIFEFPAADRQSLASIAYQQPAANVAVLTFESKYLDGDNGTLTPGANFYVDPIFRSTGKTFETAPLSSLVLLLKNSHKNFSSLINGMNLLSAVDSEQLSRSKNLITSYIDSPPDMMAYILKSFLDKNGNTLPVIRNDRLACLFVQASTHSTMRAQLFHYVINKMLRSNFLSIVPNSTADNTATTDALVEKIVETLVSATQESRSALQLIKSQGSFVDANDIDEDTIKVALKQGTALTLSIQSIMSQIYVAINKTTKNDRMLYSGSLNTVVMMVAFDMVVSLIAKYSNQQIVSRRSGGKSGNKKTTYTVAKTNLNHRNSVSDLTTRLSREQSLTQQITYTVLNTLQKLSDSIEGFVNYLKAPNSIEKLQVVSRTLPDPNTLQMLLTEQQIMLLGSTIFDFASRFKQSTTNSHVDLDKDGDFDANDEIKILDDSAISPKLRNAVFGLFNTPEFVGARAYNKRVLTVGIPLGFTRRLKQKISQTELKKTSFVSKQHDIVQVAVYKTDLINQDIVYKPLRFMFEMSRFPVRDDTYYKTLKTNPTLSDIANAIPTRDWEESFEDGQQSVSYWDSKNVNANNGKNAMDSDSYDFLTQNQKAEIIKNHLTSHMLETYIKLTAGISVSEQVFDLLERPSSVEADFVKLLTEHMIQNTVDFAKFTTKPLVNLTGGTKLTQLTSAFQALAPTGGVLFSTTLKQTLPTTNGFGTHHITQVLPKTTSASGVANKITSTTYASLIENPVSKTTTKVMSKTNSLSSAIDSLSYRQIPKVIHSLKTLSSFSKIQTTLSDHKSITKQLLTPKQFDRVFNVVVDPDEFEIDVVKTTATPYGKEAFNQLIKRGDVVATGTYRTEKQLTKTLPVSSTLTKVTSRPILKGTPDPNINNFKFRDRDRSEGDLMFEKYFITIETFGEDGV